MDWSRYQLNLENWLSELGYSLTDSRPLCVEILKLSNHYQSREPTPWEEKGTQAAYLSYFMPLNFLRGQAVFEIFRSLQPDWSEIQTVLDFGSGTGTSEALLRTLPLNFQNLSVEAVEISSTAVQWHKAFHQNLNFDSSEVQTRWSSKPTKTRYDLGLFQTSLNEMSKPPDALFQCENLILIEASTAEKSRPLLVLRQKLLESGFYLWAPCTHQNACPLLIHSKKDWCHDRIAVQLPPWFENFKTDLPMENHELTFSYLIARMIPPPQKTAARVIGDPLWEKGKVRQMICRTDEREFLSWLRRKGDPHPAQRGDLIATEGWPESPRHEIRLDSDVKTLWTRSHCKTEDSL